MGLLAIHLSVAAHGCAMGGVQRVQILAVAMITPPHNDTQPRAPSMQVLKFEEIENGHTVKNVLVDQGRIERTVLARDYEEAVGFLRDPPFM